MGDRNTRIGRHGDCRGHARNDLKRHALLFQQQRFLAAAPEDERVSALQAHDAFPFFRFVGQQLVDVALLHRMVRGRLADVNHFRVILRPPQDAVVGEAVIDHDVGFLQTFNGLQCNQPIISRSRAYKKYHSRHIVSLSTQ